MLLFQHYEVKERPDGSPWELGRGAMGVSYLARDTMLDREVALKVVNAQYLQNETAQRRFHREARAAAKISHENVALVYQFGQEGDSFFYAMEFVRGETVEQLLLREGPIAPATAVELTIQVCRALSAADREDLIHRDIKPANLMLTAHEGALRVKVIDFGLAKPSNGFAEGDATLTVAGFVGTPYYASPEQLQEQELDIRSDIYSLGVTLWYMLAGNPPFSGTFANLIVQHIHGSLPVDRLKGVPPALLSVLEKALQKKPEIRFQTPSEFREALEACKPALIDALSLRTGENGNPSASSLDDATLADLTMADVTLVDTPIVTVPSPPPLPPVVETSSPAVPAASPPQSAPPAIPPHSNKPLFLLLSLGLLLVVFAGGGIVFFLLRSNTSSVTNPKLLDIPKAEAVMQPQPSPTASPAVSPTPVATTLPPVEPVKTDIAASPTPVVATPILTPAPTAQPTPDIQAEVAKVWQRGQAEEQQGQLSTAIATYLRMLHLDPQDSRSMSRLSTIFSEMDSQRKTSGSDAPLGSVFTPLAEQAATAGVTSAMLLLGNALADTQPEQAENWYANAARKGNPQAMNDLGMFYAKPHPGIPVNADRSIELFTRASELGNATGKLFLADSLLIKEGVFANYYDPQKALGLLKESAAAGEARAMRKLGYLYDKGIAVPANDLMAFQWYESAWKKGYARAAGDIGICYMTGRGVPAKDTTKGAQYFAEGAAKQDAFSMFQYARCLNEGIGVPKDESLARKYFAEAATRGDTGAIATCNKLGIPFKSKTP